MEKSRHVNWNRTSRRNHYVLFSKSGYTEELKNYAAAEDVMLFLPPQSDSADCQTDSCLLY